MNFKDIAKLSTLATQKSQEATSLPPEPIIEYIIYEKAVNANLEEVDIVAGITKITKTEAETEIKKLNDQIASLTETRNNLQSKLDALK